MSKNAEHLEDISQLKARYFRLMDTQQWDSWHIVLQMMYLLLTRVPLG